MLLHVLLAKVAVAKLEGVEIHTVHRHELRRITPYSPLPRHHQAIRLLRFVVVSTFPNAYDHGFFWNHDININIQTYDILASGPIDIRLSAVEVLRERKRVEDGRVANSHVQMLLRNG